VSGSRHGHQPPARTERTAQQCAAEQNAVHVELNKMVHDESLPDSLRAAIAFHAASILASPATQHLDLYNLRIR